MYFFKIFSLSYYFFDVSYVCYFLDADILVHFVILVYRLIFPGIIFFLSCFMYPGLWRFPCAALVGLRDLTVAREVLMFGSGFFGLR